MLQRNAFNNPLGVVSDFPCEQASINRDSARRICEILDLPNALPVFNVFNLIHDFVSYETNRQRDPCDLHISVNTAVSEIAAFSFPVVRKIAIALVASKFASNPPLQRLVLTFFRNYKCPIERLFQRNPVFDQIDKIRILVC